MPKGYTDTLRKLPGTILLVVCLATPIQGSPVLQSETWINHAGNGAAGSFTAYQYDSRGLRILKRVHKSLDSSGSLMSQTEYAYNEARKLVTEKLVLKDALGATTEYGYDAQGRLSVMVEKTGNGSEKYRDSLVYDSTGILMEQRRRKGDELVFFHRFGFDPLKKLISDITFENDGSTFVATQSVLFAYDDSQRQFAETHSRIVDDIWFASRTRRMEYTKGYLSKLREFEGDGESGTLLMTVAYLYDGSGNRVREELSDGSGKVLSTTIFEWWEGVTLSVLPSGREVSRIPVIRIQGPYIKASGSELRILDLRGRLLHSSEEIGKGRILHLSSPSILIVPKKKEQSSAKSGNHEFPKGIATSNPLNIS